MFRLFAAVPYIRGPVKQWSYSSYYINDYSYDTLSLVRFHCMVVADVCMLSWPYSVRWYGTARPLPPKTTYHSSKVARVASDSYTILNISGKLDLLPIYAIKAMTE